MDISLNYPGANNKIFLSDLKIFESLYINRFKWTSLPSHLNSDFIEKMLFYYGKLIYAQDDKTFYEQIKNMFSDKEKGEKYLFPFVYKNFLSEYMTDWSYAHSTILIVPLQQFKKFVKPKLEEMKKMPFLFANKSQTSPFRNVEYELYMLSYIKKVMQTGIYNLADIRKYATNIEDKLTNLLLDEFDIDNVRPIQRQSFGEKELKSYRIKDTIKGEVIGGNDKMNSIMFVLDRMHGLIEEKLGIFTSSTNKKSSAQESGEEAINFYAKVVQILKMELNARIDCLKFLRKIDSRFQNTKVEFSAFVEKKIEEYEEKAEEKEEEKTEEKEEVKNDEL